jgi:hypothetical protein
MLSAQAADARARIRKMRVIRAYLTTGMMRKRG